MKIIYEPYEKKQLTAMQGLLFKGGTADRLEHMVEYTIFSKLQDIGEITKKQQKTNRKDGSVAYSKKLYTLGEFFNICKYAEIAYFGEMLEESPKTKELSDMLKIQLRSYERKGLFKRKELVPEYSDVLFFNCNIQAYISKLHELGATNEMTAPLKEMLESGEHLGI